MVRIDRKELRAEHFRGTEMLGEKSVIENRHIIFMMFRMNFLEIQSVANL